MTKRKIRAFIARLKLARAAVQRGNTGCQAEPTKCWFCAMRYRTGVQAQDPNYLAYDGPEASWSFERPKSHTLAMFDNSIAALERALHPKDASR